VTDRTDVIRLDRRGIQWSFYAVMSCESLIPFESSSARSRAFARPKGAQRKRSLIVGARGGEWFSRSRRRRLDRWVE
jgi:hypothetical protein